MTKYRVAKWLTAAASNGLLDGLKVTTMLPFHSIRKWRNALVMVTNKELLDSWHDLLKDRLYDLTEELGNAGAALCEDHYNSWLWAVVECHITHRKFGAQKRQSKKRKGAPLESAFEESCATMAPLPACILA